MIDKKISDRQIRIRRLQTGEEMLLVPKAVESCMVPGTFRITPIVVVEKENAVCYQTAEKVVEILYSDLESGSVQILQEPFEPKVYRRTKGCSPCTNCGACSW